MPDKGTTKEAPKKAAPKTAKKSKPAKAGGLKIKLVRSLIGTTQRQREVVRGLGLRRLQQTVERQDTPEIRGMVTKVSHLVKVIEG